MVENLDSYSDKSLLDIISGFRRGLREKQSLLVGELLAFLGTAFYQERREKKKNQIRRRLF